MKGLVEVGTAEGERSILNGTEDGSKLALSRLIVTLSPGGRRGRREAPPYLNAHVEFFCFCRCSGSRRLSFEVWVASWQRTPGRAPRGRFVATVHLSSKSRNKNQIHHRRRRTLREPIGLSLFSVFAARFHLFS